MGSTTGNIAGGSIFDEVGVVAAGAVAEGRASGEVAAALNKRTLARWGIALLRSRGRRNAQASLGAMALRTKTEATQQQRRAVIAGRLLSHEWPATDLRITAVRADNGELRVAIPFRDAEASQPREIDIQPGS